MSGLDKEEQQLFDLLKKKMAKNKKKEASALVASEPKRQPTRLSKTRSKERIVEESSGDDFTDITYEPSEKEVDQDGSSDESVVLDPVFYETDAEKPTKTSQKSKKQRKSVESDAEQEQSSLPVPEHVVVGLIPETSNISLSVQHQQTEDEEPFGQAISKGRKRSRRQVIVQDGVRPTANDLKSIRHEKICQELSFIKSRPKIHRDLLSLYVPTWSNSQYLKPFPRFPVMTDKQKDEAVKAKLYNNQVVLPYVNEHEFPELMTFGAMLNKIESSQKHKKEFMQSFTVGWNQFRQQN